MKDWIRLNTFSRIHQAEWRKHFLKEANINAIVMHKQDSAFLLGEYELYVESRNVEKARSLIDAYVGWAKVNSFHKMKQIALMKELIEAHGIETKVLDKLKNSYLLDKFVLYVKTEDEEKAQQIIASPDGWDNIASIHNINQAAYRVDLLQKNAIDTIIVKSRDSDMHVEAVKLFVKTEQANDAIDLLKNLPGWVNVGTYNNEAFAETLQVFLENNKITPITKVRFDGGGVEKIDFFVPQSKEIQTRELIAENISWKKVKSFDYLSFGEYYKDMLENNDIEAVLFVKKDSAFLLGDIELYVETKDLDKAKELIANAEEFDETEMPTE